MRSILGGIASLFLIILFSCSSKSEKSVAYSLSVPPPSIEEESNNNYSPKNAAEYKVPPETDNSKSEAIEPQSTLNKKKIIKDGNISVKTNDIAVSKKNIDDLLKKLNAYYETEDLQNNEQTISYELKIRVPAENFEKLISGIDNGKDEIKSKSINARDVTEEYVDIESRLINKRAYLKRYKELLSKASTVKDILAIEENIRALQEEIESKEGRLKYLNDQVAFSTLDIHLYKEKEFIYQPEQQDNFLERLKKSISNGWTSSVDFVLGVITLWPFIILVVIIVFIVRRIIKKRKSRLAK